MKLDFDVHTVTRTVLVLERNGNPARGETSECVPLSTFTMTWEFGGELSWVAVRIEREVGARSGLSLCHVRPFDDKFWPRYGPGAASFGLHNLMPELAHYLGGGKRIDENSFADSIVGKAFVTTVSKDCGLH